MWRTAVAGLVVLAMGGCGAAPVVERGTPLYTIGAAPLPRSKVALLDFQQPSSRFPMPSIIETVDGRDVSQLLSPFVLLPGCHIVEVSPPWTIRKGTAATAAPGTEIYMINMRAGREYTALSELLAPLAGSAQYSLHLVERDSDGHAEEIMPATSTADPQGLPRGCAGVVAPLTAGP
ncbi:MAG TPA: hypothetical protein VKZ18_13840 [Polyangia bacterium]|nr:hypothetical protein [Polyangia bacterium]